MKILAIRRESASGNTLARFDAELAPGVRAYGLKLVQAKTGLRVYGPSISGGPAVTFAPELAAKLAKIVNGEIAHDKSAA